MLAFPAVATAALKEGIKLGFNKDFDVDDEASMETAISSAAMEVKQSYEGTALQGLAVQLAARREISANSKLDLEIRLVCCSHLHESKLANELKPDKRAGNRPVLRTCLLRLRRNMHAKCMPQHATLKMIPNILTGQNLFAATSSQHTCHLHATAYLPSNDCKYILCSETVCCDVVATYMLPACPSIPPLK